MSYFDFNGTCFANYQAEVCISDRVNKLETLKELKIQGNKMAEYTKEIDENEMGDFNKAFLGFLIGIGTVLSMWFFSGLYYVILN